MYPKYISVSVIQTERNDILDQRSVKVRSHATIFRSTFLFDTPSTKIASRERKIRKSFENRLAFNFHPRV
jgi:hypothetical protein